MRKFLVLPLLLLASFSFAGSKYQTDYLTVNSSMKLGAVTVIHSSGTYDVYSPTNTTEGAYGAALSRSFSSWTDKMELRLGPGVFDMGENYLTLYTSTRSALIGAGKNLTKLKFSGAGYAIQPSSYCYLANFGFGESGAGIGGLTDVSGSHLIVDNVSVYGSQDGIALNGQFDTIDIYDSEIGTTFDAIAWSNTSSTATINVYNSKILSRGGSINAHGFECFGAGIVNSYNNYVEVKDAGTRVGYDNASGLGSCTFNIYGGVIQTFNGGTDMAMNSGVANVTSNLVYISSKTSGTINQLNQTGTTDTSQVYRTTTTTTHPYGISVSSSSSNVTLNVNSSGVSSFVGAGTSFSVSTDEGSSISVSEINASLYANANASITGESSASLYGRDAGVNILSGGTPIVLDPNYDGTSGGSVTVKELLAVNDTNSQFETYVGTLPVNSGFGPQVVTGGIWNRTNNSGDTLGSFNLVVSTTPRMVSAGGAPRIPAKGASLSFTSSGVSYSTYNYDNSAGETQWYYDSSGLTVNNAVTATNFIGDGSALTNLPGGGDNLGTHVATKTITAGYGIFGTTFNYTVSGSTFQFDGASVTATVPIIVKSTNNYPSAVLKDDNNRGRLQLYSRLGSITANPTEIYIDTDTINTSLNSLRIIPYEGNTRMFFGSSARPFYSLNMSNVTAGFEGLTILSVTDRLGHSFGRYIGGESGQQNHWQTYYGWVFKPNMGLSYTNAYSTVGSGLNQWGVLIAGQLGSATQFAIRGATSQTSPLQVWENVSGSTLAYVDNSGNLYTPSITGISGDVSISSTTFTGGMTLFSRSLAQLDAMAPASVGISYYCTTCTQEAVCISTGTAIGAFSSVADKTNVCN